MVIDGYHLEEKIRRVHIISIIIFFASINDRWLHYIGCRRTEFEKGF